jgi:hypothetical protein
MRAENLDQSLKEIVLANFLVLVLVSILRHGLREILVDPNLDPPGYIKADHPISDLKLRLEMPAPEQPGIALEGLLKAAKGLLLRQFAIC